MAERREARASEPPSNPCYFRLKSDRSSRTLGYHLPATREPVLDTRPPNLIKPARKCSGGIEYFDYFLAFLEIDPYSDLAENTGLYLASKCTLRSANGTFGPSLMNSPLFQGT